MADPERTRSILMRAGFDDVAFTDVREGMYFGENADDAFGFVRSMGFTSFMLQGLDDAAQAQAIDALRAVIVAHDTGEGVWFESASWIVGARKV